MRKMIFLPFVFMLSMSNTHIDCQSMKLPYWLLFDQGNAFMESKEYGSALVKYQEAIAKAGTFPEAEMAIGDIYREEGEADLAIRYYTKAYNLRNSFYIPETKYDCLYKLSRVFEEQKMYRQMEDSLMAIVMDDKGFNKPSTSHLRDQIESNYYNKGLDFILKLYRFDSFFPESAHSSLGWFYYKTGRFKQSVIHLLFSLICKTSQASGYMSSKDVDFQFTTIKEFLSTSSADKEISRYLENAEIYKDLYYLAGATFAEGYPQHASQIWKLLADFKAAGKYSELGRKQLKSPWIEPFLQITSQAK
jgi:tetratricopeptide (TPR) repeat protein